MLDSTTLADIEWLVSGAAEPWLAEAATARGSLPAQAARLRKLLSAQQAALVLEQAELRQRAAEKFPHAAQMYFTRQALEQATDAWIAAYKAARFPARPILDLCSGIGGDALGLAGRAPVTAVERDPRIARLAAANAEVCGVAAHVRLRAADVAELAVNDLGEFAAVHIDPDRRPARRRTSELDRSQPSVDVVDAWRRAAGGAAVKLAPASDLPDSWLSETEREWISRGGECRQQVAWSGTLADSPGCRRATRVESGSVASLLSEAVGSRPAAVAPLASYLHEPDPAVIAAGLVDELAAQTECQRLDRRIAYLTSDRPCPHRLAASFEVCEVLPFDVRRVKQALAARGWSRLEIKLRGVEQRPEALRERLRVAGNEQGTLLLARIADRVVAILARRSERSLTYA